MQKSFWFFFPRKKNEEDQPGDEIEERLIAMAENIKPPTITNPDEQTTRNAENALGLALFFSGARCLLIYAFLPFVLPVMGLAGGVAAGIGLAINTVAIGAILYSLRTFWRIDYKYKWHYLPLALFALALLTSFVVMDFAALVGI